MQDNAIHTGHRHMQDQGLLLCFIPILVITCAKHEAVEDCVISEMKEIGVEKQKNLLFKQFFCFK